MQRQAVNAITVARSCLSLSNFVPFPCTSAADRPGCPGLAGAASLSPRAVHLVSVAPQGAANLLALYVLLVPYAEALQVRACSSTQGRAPCGLRHATKGPHRLVCRLPAGRRRWHGSSHSTSRTLLLVRPKCRGAAWMRVQRRWRRCCAGGLVLEGLLRMRAAIARERPDVVAARVAQLEQGTAEVCTRACLCGTACAP